MPRAHVRAVLCASLVVACTAQVAASADLICGATAPNGGAMLLKRIDVRAAGAIIGVRFTSNDASTIFPRVFIAAGGFETPGAMRVLAEAHDVAAGGQHHLVVPLASVAVEAGRSLYIGVELPADDGILSKGAGPGVPASQRVGDANSFFMSPDASQLGAMDVEYDMDVVLAASAPAVGKAGSSTSSPLSVAVTVPTSGRGLSVNVTLPISTSLRVDVYDVRGRLIRRVADGTFPQGVAAADWDGSDTRGARVAAGTYIVSVTALGQSVNRKVVLAD